MFFNVISWRDKYQNKSNNKVYLRKDNWNDFGFKTQFFLVYKDTNGRLHEVGYVKIGEFQRHPVLTPVSPAVPESFDSLNEEFFSIGQSESYYKNLNGLGSPIRDKILLGLQDLAKNPANLERALKETMMTTSLMRDVALQSIKNRFHRLAKGDARLTAYKFSYTAPTVNTISPLTLTFEVIPQSDPPTNIHVLIGRNGVGKTYLLTKMTLSIISGLNSIENNGVILADDTNEDTGLFANLILVSFSAFDTFDSLPIPKSETIGVNYSYIGLKQFNKKTKTWKKFPKHIQILTNEFVDSFESCLVNGKSKLLQKALEILGSDPMFETFVLIDLIKEGEDLPVGIKRKFNKRDERTRIWHKNLTKLFGDLSSGHKIVLLTLTRLIEKVVERTLILIDEPEAHLHPPLLSAFIRALSDLLLKQNGVAILATHSPVVIQEVPKNCVWKLRKSGFVNKADRPLSETFGENVGVLTRDIFGLEVTQSGFHKMLKEAVELNKDYDSVINHFTGQLGAEARAIIQGLILTKDKNIEKQ